MGEAHYYYQKPKAFGMNLRSKFINAAEGG